MITYFLPAQLLPMFLIYKLNKCYLQIRCKFCQSNDFEIHEEKPWLKEVVKEGLT